MCSFFCVCAEEERERGTERERERREKRASGKRGKKRSLTQRGRDCRKHRKADKDGRFWCKCERERRESARNKSVKKRSVFLLLDFLYRSQPRLPLPIPLSLFTRRRMPCLVCRYRLLTLHFDLRSTFRSIVAPDETHSREPSVHAPSSPSASNSANTAHCRERGAALGPHHAFILDARLKKGKCKEGRSDGDTVTARARRRGGPLCTHHL